MEQLLRLIEADCTLTHKQLAAMTGTSEEKVDAEIKRLEEDGTIVGYKAVVDWDKTGGGHCPDRGQSGAPAGRWIRPGGRAHLSV